MDYFKQHQVSQNSQQIIPLGRERNDKPDNEQVVAKIHTFLLKSLIQCSAQSRTDKGLRRETCSTLLLHWNNLNRYLPIQWCREVFHLQGLWESQSIHTGSDDNQKLLSFTWKVKMQNSQSKTLNILILFLPLCNIYRFYMKKITSF